MPSSRFRIQPVSHPLGIATAPLLAWNTYACRDRRRRSERLCSEYQESVMSSDVVIETPPVTVVVESNVWQCNNSSGSPGIYRILTVRVA